MQDRNLTRGLTQLIVNAICTNNISALEQLLTNYPDCVHEKFIITLSETIPKVLSIAEVGRMRLKDIFLHHNNNKFIDQRSIALTQAVKPTIRHLDLFTLACYYKPDKESEESPSAFAYLIKRFLVGKQVRLRIMTVEDLVIYNNENALWKKNKTKRIFFANQSLEVKKAFFIEQASSHISLASYIGLGDYNFCYDSPIPHIRDLIDIADGILSKLGNPCTPLQIDAGIRDNYKLLRDIIEYLAQGLAKTILMGNLSQCLFILESTPVFNQKNNDVPKTFKLVELRALDIIRNTNVLMLQNQSVARVLRTIVSKKIFPIDVCFKTTSILSIQTQENQDKQTHCKIRSLKTILALQTSQQLLEDIFHWRQQLYIPNPLNGNKHVPFFTQPAKIQQAETDYSAHSDDNPDYLETVLHS